MSKRKEIVKSMFPDLFNVIICYDYRFEGKFDSEFTIFKDNSYYEIQDIILLNENQILVNLNMNMQIWDLNTQNRIAIIECPNICHVKLLSDGRIVANLKNREIRIWNFKISYKPERIIPSKYNIPYTNIIVLSDDTLVGHLIVDSFSFIEAWNPDTGENILSVQAGYEDITCLSALPDNRIITAFQDGTIKIWKNGKLEKTLLGFHKGYYINKIELLNNTHIVSMSGSPHDMSLKIWNLETGNLEHILQGHTDCITQFLILPNNKIASGSSDGNIRIWNNEGKCERILRADGEVRKMGYTIDDQIVCSYENYYLRSWDPETGKRNSKAHVNVRLVNNLIVHPQGWLIIDCGNKICIYK